MTRQPVTAVLLAAGRGRRLRPYTDSTPKPLLSVGDRPTLDFVLTAVSRAGIENVCLVTHHLSEQIEVYVGDGSAWNLRAVSCRQATLKGTAHALMAATSSYPDLFVRNLPFILSATDYILPENYLKNLVTAHLQNGNDITLSLKELTPQKILTSSTVHYQPNGKISRIIEKPRPEEITSRHSSSLTFILPGSILNYLPQMKPSQRGEFEIQSVINNMIEDGYSAGGLVLDTPNEWEPGMLTGDAS